MESRRLHLLAVAMFFATFAWSFVYVSLPFHVQEISTADATSTLRWTGWILGISPLVTVITAPVWGRLAARGDARALYVVVEALQGLGFFGMALARTLPELFLARLVLGGVGAASTFAFVIAGRSGSSADVRRGVAAVQSAMTVGQVVGPLAGAVAAARMGFRPSFVVGGLVLLACAGLVRWGLPGDREAATTTTAARPVAAREVAAVFILVLGGSTQIFFLTAVLPQVLPTVGVAPPDTLEMGGLVIFASGVAAAVGALLAPRLGDLLPERRLITTLFVTSSVSLAALALVGSLWLYGVVRFVQVLCIAPVFPLVVSRVVQHAGGAAIGIINSARIGAAFVGPVVATTLLSWTSPTGLYLLLATVGLACAALVLPTDDPRAGGTGPVTAKAG